MKGIILMGILAVLVCFRGHALDARNIHNDTTLTILTYGIRIVQVDRARDVVAKKYGFRFLSVEGCTVTQELMDSVKKENDATNAVLAKKLGKNWEKRFDKELEKVIHIQTRIEEQVLKEAYIIAKQQELAKNNHSLDLLITPLPKSRQWEVKAYGWEREDDEMPVIFYKMKADLRRKKIELLSSKPEKMQID